MTPLDYDFMKLAREVGTQSGCIRPLSRFGAVAVKNGEVLASGYNGHVGEIPPCNECIRAKQKIKSGTRREIANCICAEQRLICNSARDGVALGGATIYVTGMPCPVCVRLIKAAGINRVIHPETYSNNESIEMAKLVGLEMITLI